MNWTLIISIASIVIAVLITITSWSFISKTKKRLMRSERDLYERDYIFRRRVPRPGEKWEYKWIDEPYQVIENEFISDKPRLLRGDVIPKLRGTEKEKVIYEKKKEKFLNVANISFHYADKERIKAFYDDYFKEPTIKDLIRETVSEADASIKGSIPSIIESKLGSKDLSKWISTIKLPDLTEGGMFKRYQAETIKQDQVALGLEEDDIELNVLKEFEKEVELLESNYGYKFDIDSLEIQKRTLKEKAAERTLNNLENASGWVLVEGNFQILSENQDFYKVSMIHPVSNYLSSSKSITLSCLIPKSKIEPSVAGNYANSVNKYIPLRIYGQIWQPINRKQDIWDLVITPLAIY